MIQPSAQAWRRRHGLACLAFACVSAPACAQSLSSPIPSATISAPTLSTSQARSPTSEPLCRQLDALAFRGFESPIFPSNCETIDADWAYRRALLDYGIRTGFYSLNQFQYDMLGHNTPSPRYTGEDPIYHLAETLEVTYDASRIGLPKGSEFSTGLTLYRNDYAGSAPNALSFTELDLWLPLLRDRVEVNVGYLEWLNAFYGTNLGTSAASSALGPTSNMITELGIASVGSTPGFSAKIWDAGHHWYDNFGVSRSAAPNSGFAFDTGRGPSLEFVVPGTGALFVNEIGYLVKRSPTNHFFWIRGGALYNNSEYPNYADNLKKTRGNEGFFLTGDYQITHPSKDHYATGWYVNFKLDAASPDVNLFCDDASISAYVLGPFPGRVLDSASVGFTYNRLSHTEEDYSRSRTNPLVPYNATTLVGSYSYSVIRGLFFTNSLSWVTHPASKVPNPENAIEITSRISFLF